MKKKQTTTVTVCKSELSCSSFNTDNFGHVLQAEPGDNEPIGQVVNKLLSIPLVLYLNLEEARILLGVATGASESSLATPAM